MECERGDEVAALLPREPVLDRLAVAADGEAAAEVDVDGRRHGALPSMSSRPARIRRCGRK